MREVECLSRLSVAFQFVQAEVGDDICPFHFISLPITLSLFPSLPPSPLTTPLSVILTCHSHISTLCSPHPSANPSAVLDRAGGDEIWSGGAKGTDDRGRQGHCRDHSLHG